MSTGPSLRQKYGVFPRKCSWWNTNDDWQVNGSIGLFSVQALSCHKCPAHSSFKDCLTNLEYVTCATGWNKCFNMKLFIRKSSGEEILYLDNKCGLDFVCNQPDPNYVCNIKNTTLTDQEHTLVNCTSRSCTTDMCNNDDLPPPPPAPSTPVITHPMPSIALSINVSGLHGNQTGTNAIVAPSTPENGTSSTMATPADYGKGSGCKRTLGYDSLVSLWCFSWLLNWFRPSVCSGTPECSKVLCYDN